MTREEKSLCPVCGKKKSRMAAHFSISHPELNPDDYGVVGPAVRSEAIPPPAFDPEPEEAPPAAPAEPLENPAVVQAINSLVTHIERQAATIQAQQERIEAIGKDLAAFQQSVVQNLNEVPKVVNHAVTAQFDQILAEAQAKAAAAGNGQGEAGMVEMPPAMPPTGRPDPIALLTQLAPLFLQQPKPAGGDLMQQVAMLKSIAEAFNPMPNILAGMNMATTMFTAAARAGIDPANAAKGNEHLIDNMKSLGPSPPTGQTH